MLILGGLIPNHFERVSFHSCKTRDARMVPECLLSFPSRNTKQNTKKNIFLKFFLCVNPLTCIGNNACQIIMIKKVPHIRLQMQLLPISYNIIIGWHVQVNVLVIFNNFFAWYIPLKRWRESIHPACFDALNNVQHSGFCIVATKFRKINWRWGKCRRTSLK